MNRMILLWSIWVRTAFRDISRIFIQVLDGVAVAEAVNQVAELLKTKEIIVDYQI